MPRGTLTKKQVKYAELVASGMAEKEAVLEAGYAEQYLYQNLEKLRTNDRVQEMIRQRQEQSVCDIADEEEIMLFWTQNMRNPALSHAQRTENSRLLGKAKQMFVQKQEIDAKMKHEAVMVVPEMSPEAWEAYWEDNHGR